MATAKKPAQELPKIGENYHIPDMEGYSFMWVNPDTYDRSGWGIWHPVEKDSAVGERIAAMLKEYAPGTFSGLSVDDSNFFYRGRDTMLALAKIEHREAAIAKMQKAADTPSRS